MNRNIVNTKLLVINVLRRFISDFRQRKGKPLAGFLNPLYTARISLYGIFDRHFTVFY
jgi:hypothetical protein